MCITVSQAVALPVEVEVEAPTEEAGLGSHMQDKRRATHTWRSTHAVTAALHTTSHAMVSPHLRLLYTSMPSGTNAALCSAHASDQILANSLCYFSDTGLRVAERLSVLGPPSGDWLQVRTRAGLEGWVKRKNVYYISS